ncbi:phosphate propanoyltransferase [Loigolactobacillus coryniformis]|uniref:Phosphate propanoyltransferase n=1 Tax=Loigolactobacillus coryniformis TaxID=1610 RepID=A0A5B8TEH5_9LACO|nr:ethanolamine utilization phosphate acetyltransferase EutD [Loigolactobacillus coryniformis]MBW4803201.1 phosphate propanoyltransferase [Loigolactobacillus coryniformis subsp. torquens]MBW4805896.1 phosphate propanoyltransferase [Loigolactobacillus coryniformis subsp. torquens]MDC4184964.1 phosphate propanoyltransferase [Loigolactobacillus coryniformis]MDN5954522.1 phosphate propanoyltransferase [Loigolactobacillus coryniformis]QEA53123.1 phosphate propanoyltransferase [Loigolactobacillus co
MLITNNLDEIIKRVVTEVQKKVSFEIEASGRHVHLDRPTIDALFGTGYQLTPQKWLSQPGQYASKERVNVKGPNGELKNVAILGPERRQSQVEMSLTDARTIGIKAPIRESGHLDSTPGVTLINDSRSIMLDSGAIVAQRHIHMTPEDAKLFNVQNGDIVQVKTHGERPLIFDAVVVRVSDKFATYMHIDFDEANACGLSKGLRGTIVKCSDANA